MSRPFLLAAALLGMSAASVSAQSITLTLREGRVTLITQNAMPAAILAEWARQGQVRVVDGDRIPGTPLTLRLENVPEREALDIVLRGAAGYIAAPRTQAAAANLSRFDRLIVMGTSPGAGMAARNTPAATRQAPGVAVQNTPPVQADEDAQAQQALVQEAQEPPQAAGVEQPVSSTNFDYANPQRYFAARQAEQQAAEAAAQAGSQPSASPMGSLGQTTSRPGVLPTPTQQGTPGAAGNGNAVPANPYGLPAGPTPGSSATPSTLEPDRAKYINPYSPTPPRP
ncbi:hypothetical protein TBR22_A49070 [Luteitalea sp. TBR-22]|uniref:hypothetical protein n=1 Tax=Luteitalea sp. TBR-22 TaxID=2802971 RepID=UPI001AF84383|nr:hypothetical protein [Luteitalea sp. TBR-22]BCS35673.1 hypothetical protein TBR22_A49070 [Luteitalea sp. TBR-22]